MIHWNESKAKDYAKDLGRFGFVVQHESADGARAGSVIKEWQPGVAVIYHTRLPSHGRETADYLLRTKATRNIPVVFVGGKKEDLEEN